MSSSTSEATLGWRQQFASLGTIWPLFKMLWATSPYLFVGTTGLRLARAALPVILLWIPKQAYQDGHIAWSSEHLEVHAKIGITAGGSTVSVGDCGPE